MRSKIPHVKATRNDEKRTQSGNPIKDPSLVHDAFVLLGAPHVEREEFSRLYHGPLADALCFLSEHMKGRREVALARHQIHQIREERLSSNLRRPDDITRPATDKAASILSGAKKDVEMLKKQLNDRQAELEETRETLEQLRRDLDENRRTKLLLNVLEQKEKIRVKRFQEMAKLIADLRKAATEVKPQLSMYPIFTEPNNKAAQTPMAKNRPPRISHTSNALTNLHAYHLCLSRSIKSEGSSASELFARLRTGIVRQTGKSESDPNIGKIVDQFISVAKARAKGKQQFQSHSLPPVSELELEKKYKVNREKERELQDVSDLTIALGFLCEHSISSVNVFVEKSSSVLRSSLDEEAPLAKGYIDVLRSIIMAPRAPDQAPGETSFVQQVRGNCGLGRKIVPSEIVAWVEAAVRKAHRQALFLDALTVPQPSPITEEHKALVASYEANAKNVQDRTVKLLTRKVEKAEMGYSLAKDIQNLLQDTKTIVG